MLLYAGLTAVSIPLLTVYVLAQLGVFDKDTY